MGTHGYTASRARLAEPNQSAITSEFSMKRSFNLLLTLSTLAPAALAQAPTTEPPPPVPPADPAPIPARALS